MSELEMYGRVQKLSGEDGVIDLLKVCSENQ